MFSEHALPQQGNALNMQINSQLIHTHIICIQIFNSIFANEMCFLVFHFFRYIFFVFLLCSQKKYHLTHKQQQQQHVLYIL